MKHILFFTVLMVFSFSGHAQEKEEQIFPDSKAISSEVSNSESKKNNAVTSTLEGTVIELSLIHI